MPPYVQSTASQNSPPIMLIPGQPAYAWGSKPTNQPTRKLTVTSVAIASNVVTLGVQLVEGFIPKVGDLITVVNTTTDSGAANVTNASITGVSIASSGAGTITYAATGTNQSTTPDTGMAWIPVSEVAEALIGGGSQQFSIQNTIGRGYGVTWAYTLPSQPASISIQLEGAMNDNPAEYTAIGSAQTTTGGYNEIVAQVPNLVNFLRIKVNSFSGGSAPSIIAKLLLS